MTSKKPLLFLPDDVSEKDEAVEAINKVAAVERENELDVFVLSVESKSTNDVNTGAVPTQEVGSPVSDSPEEILASKDSGISLESKEEIISDQTDGNTQAYSSARLALLDTGSKTSLDETDDLGIVPDNTYALELEDVEPCPEDGQIHSIEENDLQCSAANESEAFKTSDNITESRSVGDLSTLRSNKPNSLEEDAKLVKFSVSTKSVNLMQSNAQFLNKSRNFINFITEKSTNIMEKTLLPQNIAAKYNSILRMTENGPPNCKKIIGDTTSNTESNSSHNGCDIDEADSAIGYDIQASTGEDRNLFLKCSPSENNSAPKEPEAEAISEHVENSRTNMIKDESDYNSLERENVGYTRRNSETGNQGFVKNGVDARAPNLKSDSHSDEVKNDEPSADLELLAHPAYVKILRDYSGLKNENERLSEAMAKVEMENQRLAAENNGELHALQLEALEKSIEQLRNDLRQETSKQEYLSKEYHMANKERESMVMKYAMSEKQLIDTQR